MFAQVGVVRLVGRGGGQRDDRLEGMAQALAQTGRFLCVARRRALPVLLWTLRPIVFNPQLPVPRLGGECLALLLPHLDSVLICPSRGANPVAGEANSVTRPAWKRAIRELASAELRPRELL